MDELVKYNNIIMCGGGINECLKEVEIALNALGKPFKVLTQFTY
jgi:arabinogalactan endo-1,4-beta-galactosidase